MDHGIQVAEELYEVFLHDSSDKYGKYVETQDQKECRVCFGTVHLKVLGSMYLKP